MYNVLLTLYVCANCVKHLSAIMNNNFNLQKL